MEKGFKVYLNNEEIIPVDMKLLTPRKAKRKKGTVEPYLFEGNTYMVSQFTTEAGNGVWLSIDSRGKNALEIFKKNIKFHSHNVDHSYQQTDLMSLVDIWASYYNTVKEILS